MKLDHKICIKVEQLFLRYGIKSVSMDDISRSLGISKKTLYQAVPNKAGLISRVLDRFMQDEYTQILELKEKSNDPIHELVLMAKHMTSILVKMSPVAIHDLKKYYIDQWQAMETERNEMILEDIRRLSLTPFRPDCRRSTDSW